MYICAMMNGLQIAIDRAGGQPALARALSKETGRSFAQGHVWAWLNKNKKGPPAEIVPVISRLYGVPLEALRPDVFNQLKRSTKATKSRKQGQNGQEVRA